ncbi:hypothetical protein FRC07_005499, partial [Ceratobasidium sp. 392]
HLKLAGLKPPQDPAHKIAAGQSPSSTLPSMSASHPPFTATRPRPYERLAADKPGEELAPDAGIWQLYVEEAKEHDSELVDGKNKNLDVMLLFAALFSAILTAFIIESVTLLQEDSDDLTVTLLLAIAQSQQRIEQGAPDKLPPIERPAFSVPLTARWINGLWFMALALSLSAALIAMLAKEWLTEFVVSRPRPPRTYALMHQRRLNGLTSWQALHIVDLLPSMLHLSLLLFSLGLAIYLWTLDTGIAIAEVIITGATLFFYFGTAISSAIYSSCPYVTQVSKYMRVALHLFFQQERALENEHMELDTLMEKEATGEELLALSWLAKSARDPAVGDCAYQALAGLYLPSSPTSKLGTSSTREDAENLPEAEPIHQTVQSENEKHQDFLTPAKVAFNALDCIWNDDCPELSSDSYALLTAAELRLTEAATYARNSSPTTHSSPRYIAAQLAFTPGISRQANDSQDSWSVVNMEPAERQIPDSRLSLFELRARYSRALARAAVLLSTHNEGRACIGAHSLAYLFESIQLAAHCRNLNPASHMSTCLPQGEDQKILTTFKVYLVGTGLIRYLPALDIGDEDGIIPGLITILSSSGIEETPWLELATGHALAALAPMLFRQWIYMVIEHSPPLLNEGAVHLALDSWPEGLAPNQFRDLAYSTLLQLLCVATIATSQAMRQEMAGLPEIAITSLYRRANMTSGRFPILDVILQKPDLINAFIHFTNLNHEALRPTTLSAFLKLFLIERNGETLLVAGALSPESLLTLLRLLSKLPGESTVPQLILTELRQILPKYRLRYMLKLDKAMEWLTALAMVGNRPE